MKRPTFFTRKERPYVWRGSERYAEEMHPPGPTEWSRGFLESLADASRERRGAFVSERLSERRKLLDLFVEHRRLLLGVCRPQFEKIGR